MGGRDPHEAHRVATPLELLFDLTFVVAFASAANQFAHALAEAHFATAFLGFALAGDRTLSAPATLLALGAFVVGAGAAGRLLPGGTAERAFHTVDAMVIGGKMLGEFEHVSNPFFAPKGSRWAYRTNTPPTWTMVVDGKAQ